MHRLVPAVETMKESLEIVCSACGAESLLTRTPRYDGFTKVGEELKCASCGHVYDDEDAVPFKRGSAPAVFSENDRPREISVFRDDEKGRTCRHCEHYVVNPFVQRCGLHNREVEATDTCSDLLPREDGDD